MERISKKNTGRAICKKINDWISNGNDCSKCEYCWEARTSYEYDEWDCGCYIKGPDYDNKPCHLINPIKNILGALSKRKANYCTEHEYDGFVEFMENSDRKDNKLHELFIQKVIRNHVICWKDDAGELHECDTELMVRNNVWEVRTEYENFAHPIEHKKLRTEWKELMQKTCKKIYMKTLGKIVPYLHS